MARLMIVESPSKAKHIQHMLGSDYRVIASFGHIRDLPEKQMGVEKPKYAPQYEITSKSKDTVAKLKREAQYADEIILASDPDREGEAIAWHLREALGLKPGTYKRVTYNEVTETALKAALAKPRDIDMKLVAAQEARRVLDRLVGYRLSYPLCKALNGRFSAGRVQTPVVRLIVEREDEISSFKSTKHFGVVLHTEFGFDADWDTRPFVTEEKPYVTDRMLAMTAASVKTVTVVDQSTKKSNRRPQPPFTTSTMQQTASTKLKMGSDKTMAAAQELFEGGLITYHRTDSVSLAAEAIEAIRSYASKIGLPLPKTPQVYKSKGNAQEAHEAVRPADPFKEYPTETLSGQKLSENAKKLYRLIHDRAIACQLADKVDEVTTLVASGTADEREFKYGAKAVRNLERGYTALTGFDDDDDKVSEMPPLKKGQVIAIKKGEITDKKTNPPPRYSESSLLQALEKLGIGRPSTWASILTNILSKEFIKADSKRQFTPTDNGVRLIRRVDTTTFASIDFTATMEEHLDMITRGESRFIDVVSTMDEILDNDLKIIVEGKTA